MDSGIPSYKLVIAKTISKTDLYNGGWVKPSDLGEWTKKAYADKGWYAGVALWEYSRDKDGSAIMSAAGDITNKFLDNQIQR